MSDIIPAAELAAMEARRDCAVRPCCLEPDEAYPALGVAQADRDRLLRYGRYLEATVGDYKAAAQVEASLGDEARARAALLEAAIQAELDACQCFAPCPRCTWKYFCGVCWRKIERKMGIES